MSDIAISVKNVSKCYRTFDNQRSRLIHALWPRRSTGVIENWALRDVGFEVKKGESVGIIGRNGSGKSTLLEIITGTLQPTTGSVQINGRVAALLELGSGFNPEYTGRENVFLNGLLLGLSRVDVENRLDDITSFADIGDVLDRPVKTYSSGMLVRLAFAVQVALDPDILIVDEALSVGDYFFQQKCFGRLRQMREDGLTLLFVSHDMGTVRNLCSHAVYLQKGATIFVGDAKAAIRQYFAENDAPSQTEPPAQLLTTEPVVPAAGHFMPPAATFDEPPSDALWRTPEPKTVGILAVRILDVHGQSVTCVRMGETMKVEIYFRNPDDESATIAISLKNRYDQIVFATNALRLKIDNCRTVQAWGVLTYALEMKLEAGLYSLRVSLNTPQGANTGKEMDSTSWFGPVLINWDYERDISPFLGMFGLPISVSFVNVKGTR